MKMKFRNRSWGRGVLVALAATVTASTVAASAVPATAGAADTGAADTGKVTIVHAVPDLTVDVYANDGLLLEDFAPGTITAPVDLAPGSYKIDVTPANSSDVALTATVPVGAGDDATGVAYLNEVGSPTLGLFGNDMSTIKPSRARMTLRHTAAAPAVDVRFKRPGGEWRYATTDLMNGEQAKRGFKARKYRFDVVLAGTKTRVLGPVALALTPRRHYFVYAWGSAAEENLALNLSTRRLPLAR